MEMGTTDAVLIVLNWWFYDHWTWILTVIGVEVRPPSSLQNSPGSSPLKKKSMLFL